MGRVLTPARRFQNGLASGLIALGTVIVLVPLFLILYYLIVQGFSSLNLNFFTQTPKPVGEAGGGVVQAIVGSFIMLGIATVIGTVIGIGTGTFLSEYAEHPLTQPIRVMSDVLTGIPAIVVGLVIYGLLVRPFKSYSGLAGGVALGLIMVPVIVRASEEVLRLVPTSVREAGLALGLPRWKVIMSVVLPAARSGIITGVMLAIARVAGEAAPLLFTALGNDFLEWRVTEPMMALPLQIYKFALSPYAEHVRLAWAASLVLVLLIFLASLGARWATRKRY